MYTPSPCSAIDVPRADAVVGADPSVVKYVAATPLPPSVALNVIVTGFPSRRHALPTFAESSVVTGAVVSVPTRSLRALGAPRQ